MYHSIDLSNILLVFKCFSIKWRIVIFLIFSYIILADLTFILVDFGIYEKGTFSAPLSDQPPFYILPAIFGFFIISTAICKRRICILLISIFAIFNWLILGIFYILYTFIFRNPFTLSLELSFFFLSYKFLFIRGLTLFRLTIKRETDLDLKFLIFLYNKLHNPNKLWKNNIGRKLRIINRNKIIHSIGRLFYYLPIMFIIMLCLCAPVIDYGILKQYIPEYPILKSLPIVIIILVLPVQILGRLLIKYSFRKNINRKNHSTPKGSDFILYLRPFSIDKQKMKGNSHSYLDSWYDFIMPSKVAITLSSFEELLTDSIWEIAQIFSFGSPQDAIEPIGVNRLYKGDQDWWISFCDCSKDSLSIICAIGEGEEFWREVNYITNHDQLLDKTFFLIPPIPRRKRKYIISLLLSTLKIHDNIKMSKLKIVIPSTSSKDGFLIISKSSKRQDYECALLIAMNLLFEKSDFNKNILINSFIFKSES